MQTKRITLNPLSDEDLKECLQELHNEGFEKIQFGKPGVGRITAALRENQQKFAVEAQLVITYRVKTQEELKQEMDALTSGTSES